MTLTLPAPSTPPPVHMLPVGCGAPLDECGCVCAHCDRSVSGCDCFCGACGNPLHSHCACPKPLVVTTASDEGSPSYG